MCFDIIIVRRRRRRGKKQFSRKETIQREREDPATAVAYRAEENLIKRRACTIVAVLCELLCRALPKEEGSRRTLLLLFFLVFNLNGLSSLPFLQSQVAGRRGVEYCGLRYVSKDWGQSRARRRSRRSNWFVYHYLFIQPGVYLCKYEERLLFGNRKQIRAAQ